MNELPTDISEFTDHTFNHLDLSQSELRDKNFYDCEFHGCNFSDALLLRCRFDNCRFSGCNFSNAKIKGSSFREVAFQSGKLLGIDWPSAQWPSVALSGLLHFDECILNGSSFFGLHLQEMKMEACQAHDVDFTEADCSYASFIHTDFASATFHQTTLNKADFSDAVNYAIDVHTNKVAGTKFSLPEAVNLLKYLGIELVD